MKILLGYYELKKELTAMFQKHGITELSDIDWIMVEVTGVSRSRLPFYGKFSSSETEQIMDAAQKRIQHIPLAYIFGKTEFLGYTLKVNNNVLIPRLDTEILAIKAKEDILNREGEVSVCDMCTGSGVLAVFIAKETGANVTAVDFSSAALEVAMENAKLNDAKIRFIHSDLFEKVDGKFDFIVSNPPYIETDVCKSLEPEVVENEPIMALDGGEDGLNFYRKIISEAPAKLKSRGKIYFEIGYNQAEAVSELMKANFKDIKVYKDYGGNDRVVCGEML